MEVLIMDMNLIHLVDQHIQQDMMAQERQLMHLDHHHLFVNLDHKFFLKQMNNKISYNLN